MKHLKKFNNDFKNADLSKDMKKQNQKGKVNTKPIKKKKGVIACKYNSYERCRC